MVLPNEVKLAISLIEQNGGQAFLVGGCVRDFVMGKRPDDFDIATSFTPAKIKKCFKNYKTVDTGVKHGTVLVIIDSVPLEITTFRVDGEYKDARHPEKVTFSSSLTDDLKRRDFTINALAYNETSGIVDLFGGTDDINDKIIRTVGNPDDRFKEDALRMLRALRFSSVLGFEIEENTKESIKKNFYLVLNVSKERIFAELKKLILGDNAKKVFDEFGAELSLISGADMTKDFGGENYYQKLSSIYSDEEKAFSSLKNLKADNFTVKTVVNLIKYKNHPKDDTSFKKLMFYEGEEFCRIFDSHKTKELLSENECIFLKDLKVDGNDMLNLGIKNEKIKETLNKLLFMVHKDNSLNQKYTLLDIAKKSCNFMLYLV